ncbi:Uncharacterised protein [Mycobacteroides abscessus subsp. abscessus]|nr:Uncharacterised protein [Mycobacteroides abscessus subsp. abscessus]
MVQTRQRLRHQHHPHPAGHEFDRVGGRLRPMVHGVTGTFGDDERFIEGPEQVLVGKVGP